MARNELEHCRAEYYRACGYAGDRSPSGRNPHERDEYDEGHTARFAAQCRGDYDIHKALGNVGKAHERYIAAIDSALAR